VLDVQGQPPAQVKLKFRVLCKGVVSEFIDLAVIEE